MGCLPSTGLTSKSNGPPIEEMYTKAKAKALHSKSTNLNLNWIDLIYGSVKGKRYQTNKTAIK